MSSLPVISHHLYVAAVGNEEQPAAQVEPRPAAPPERELPAKAIPLEVMDYANPMPPRPFRQLRVAARPAI